MWNITARKSSEETIDMGHICFNLKDIISIPVLIILITF